MPTLQRFYQYVLFPIVIIGFLWLAWLIWQNEMTSLDIDYKQSVSETRSVDALNAIVKELPPLAIQPIRDFLYAASNDIDVDNELLVKIADEYIKRRPLDADGWLWASQFSQRLNNVPEAKRYLSVAHKLAKNNTPKLNQVFTRYLELGLIDEAMPVARDIAYASPNRFRRLFYLLTRLNRDYSHVVQQVIPDKVGGLRRYDDYVYFKWALTDAIRAKNEQLANAVWLSVPQKAKTNPQFSLPYLKYLASLQSSSNLMAVIKQVYNQEYSIGEIVDSGFENKLSADHHCWEARSVPGVVVKNSTRKHLGESSLLLEFEGIDNISYYHTGCLVAVESGSFYRFSGHWSGESITTLSGPFVDIYSPGIKGLYKRSEAKSGSWPWQKILIEFQVPDNVEVLSIRIRRARTDNLDSKISGKVWFDTFDLKKINEGAKNTLVDE